MLRTDILKKIDSKGKTRVWYAELDGNQYTTYAGEESGRLISKTYTITEPKGKNTPEEQAKKDMESRERKKHQRELYSYDLSKPHPLAFIQPMLARDFTKVGHQVKWDVNNYCAQPKLDGVRTIAQYDKNNKVVKLTSRKGKRYYVPTVEAELLRIFTSHPDLILDGELYIHNMELGDITHRVAHPEIDWGLGYHVFDIVDETKMFSMRHNMLKNIILTDGVLDIVPSINITEPDLNKHHDDFVNKGYEGLILRDLNTPYEIGKRPLGLFKYKKFQDSEFPLIDIVPDNEDGCRFVLKAPSGETFLSRPMGTNAMRTHFLQEKHKFIGHNVTVKYSKLLKTGVPEFNRVINTDAFIRNYE